MQENKIEFGKIAVKLTLASLISCLISATAAGVAIIFLNIRLSKPAMIGVIGAFAIAGMYFALGWYLRKNCRKWNIAVVTDDGGARSFSGVAFAALMFGLYWRTTLIGFATGAISAMLKNMYGVNLSNANELGINVLVSFVNIFIGFYWLLRMQYGSFQIVKFGSELFKNSVVDANEVIHDAKKGIKDTIVGFLGTASILSYIGLGLVQIFAVYDFFRHYWDWNWFLSLISAIFVGYTPLLGSTAGVVAAYKVWHWELWAAILLFFYPIAIWVSLILLGGTVSIFGNIFDKKRY